MIIQEEMHGIYIFGIGWYLIFLVLVFLKEVVCSKLNCVILQLKYGHAINFAVGRPDWNPAFALVQMTVYRGKTAVLTIRVFAKVSRCCPFAFMSSVTLELA